MSETFRERVEMERACCNPAHVLDQGRLMGLERALRIAEGMDLADLPDMSGARRVDLWPWRIRGLDPSEYDAYIVPRGTRTPEPPARAALREIADVARKALEEE